MNTSESYWISTNEALTMQSKTILNDYLLRLKTASMEETTISINRSILERFLSECTVPFEDLNSDDVLKWFQAYSVGKKIQTLDVVISILSLFFKFCITEDYLNNKVVNSLWQYIIPQSLPKHLNGQEYTSVKLALEQVSLRDQVLVLFLFSSGCRSSELTQLTIQDVDLAKYSAEIKGKGGRSRTILFSIECGILLKEYLSTRSGDQTEPLFLNKLNKQLGTKEIYKVTTNLGQLAGLSRTLSPNVCRHTSAMNMYSKGLSVEFITELMGHTDLRTTYK